MKIIFGAANNMILTCGVIEEGGVQLPFIGICPKTKADVDGIKLLAGVEATSKMKDTCAEHGIALLFDNSDAAQLFCQSLQMSFNIASRTTDWPDRELPVGGMN